MSGWTAKDIPDQSGRVAVITGANSGLGFYSALGLARKGARVVMACRNVEKAERARLDILRAAPGAFVEVMRLDLAELASVRKFAEAFGGRYERLDVLMNNAGVMIPPYGRTADGFESQIGVNHLGHFALTGLLIPRLIGTTGSRVVTVASGAYLSGRIHWGDLQSEKHYTAWSAYGQSKLANMLFMTELERRLERAGAKIISTAAHPGYAVTNLQKHMTSVLDRTVGAAFRPLVSQRAEPGADYQLYAATAPGVQGGDFFGPRFGLKGAVVRWGVLPHGRNPLDGARLWAVSEALTDVRYEGLDAAGRWAA